jgi:hypothetical protein
MLTFWVVIALLVLVGFLNPIMDERLRRCIVRKQLKHKTDFRKPTESRKPKWRKWREFGSKPKADPTGAGTSNSVKHYSGLITTNVPGADPLELLVGLSQTGYFDQPNPHPRLVKSICHRALGINPNLPEGDELLTVIINRFVTEGLIRFEYAPLHKNQDPREQFDYWRLILTQVGRETIRDRILLMQQGRAKQDRGGQVAEVDVAP